MMNYSTIHAYPKHQYSEDFEPAMLDLDPMDNLLVIECGNNYTVVDEQEHRLYNVKANDATEAVKKYIDWVYGEMYIYEWNAEEGGYDMTSKKERASAHFILETDRLDWEEIAEH